MGRLPRVLIFLSFLSLPPPTTIAQGFSRRTKMYAVTWMDASCDAYKIRPNCWFFFPHLIYRVLYSSASRSKRLARFVVIIYTWLFMGKKKIEILLVPSLSKFSLPFSDSSKILSHVSHFIYIYTYRKHYYIHHVSSPRLRESRKLDNYLSTYPIVFTAPFRRGIPRTIVGRTLRSTWTIDKDRAIRRLVKVEDDGIIGNVTRSRERKSYKYVILPAADG